MFILVDVDQFLFVNHISESCGMNKLALCSVWDCTFVPRELFNMIQLEYIFFSTTAAPSALDYVNIKYRMNIRNLNDALMINKMSRMYVSKLRNYFNGGKWR